MSKYGIERSGVSRRDSPTAGRMQFSHAGLSDDYKVSYDKFREDALSSGRDGHPPRTNASKSNCAAERLLINDTHTHIHMYTRHICTQDEMLQYTNARRYLRMRKICVLFNKICILSIKTACAGYLILRKEYIMNLLNR